MSNVSARIQYWDKTEKKGYECAVVWEPEPERLWKQNVSAVKATDLEHKYPKMKLSEASARAERGEGYLSLVWPSSGQPKPAASTQDDISF